MAGQITLTQTPHQKQVFVKALLQSGHNISQASRLSGLSRHTVAEIAKRNTYDADSIAQIQKRLPAKAYIAADWAFDNLTPEKMEACSAPQLMMVAGIAIDKARDMAGLNRPIINVVEIASNLQKAISESRTRMAAIAGALEANTEGSSQNP